MAIYSLTATDTQLDSKIQHEGQAAEIMLFLALSFHTAAISPATVASRKAPSQQELSPSLLNLKKSYVLRSIKLLQITRVATELPLQIWQDHRSNQMIYSDWLIGDAQQPNLFVGVGPHDLIRQSQ